MNMFSKTSIVVCFFLFMGNLVLCQNIVGKGGLYIFPHFEKEMIGNPNIAGLGYGYLGAIEIKAFKKMTIQVDYTQSFLKYKVKRAPTWPSTSYNYQESIFIAEFRYYPKAAFVKWYFGFNAAVYTSKEIGDNLNTGWKDSGYKYGLSSGYVFNVTPKFDFEPNLTIWSDLGRYPSLGELLGYPRLQFGFSVNYKF